MRIKKDFASIDYEETKRFFDNRVKKYNVEHPYSVTMYQDNNPELVDSRNSEEIKTLLPLLSLSDKSVVLDVACGIGRWSDAIQEKINSYYGIDFCEGLIEIAKERNKFENRFFFEGKSTELTHIFTSTKFNTFLLIGFLQYINDEDALTTLSEIEKISEKSAIICIKTSIGLDERLTLKNQFSDELIDNYNAIYRTRDEIVNLLSILFEKGFNIVKESYMFDNDKLNNRKETAQYYFILKR